MVLGSVLYQFYAKRNWPISIIAKKLKNLYLTAAYGKRYNDHLGAMKKVPLSDAVI